MENALEIWFPGLKNTEYDITSPKTDDYNCIAHTANDDENFWWPAPGHSWPSGMPLGDNIENFTKETLNNAGCRATWRSGRDF